MSEVSTGQVADAALGVASVAVSAARTAAGVAGRVSRRSLELLPVPGPVRRPLSSVWRSARARGQAQRASAVREIRSIADVVIPWGVEEVLVRTDVAAVVDRLDVAAIVDRVDLDAIVARVDLDLIIDRLDLIGLAAYVVDGIDLPAIVRSSSGSMTSEMVQGIRRGGADADQAVERIVDRLLLRRAERRRLAVGPNGTSGSPPT